MILDIRRCTLDSVHLIVGLRCCFKFMLKMKKNFLELKPILFRIIKYLSPLNIRTYILNLLVYLNERHLNTDKQ